MKRKASSKIHNSDSVKTTGRGKSSDSERSAGRAPGDASSLPAAKGRKNKTETSSESSQHANSRRAKGGVWTNYDDERLPELSDEQLASFKPVSKQARERFKNAQVRRVGRPPMAHDERMVPVSMRFPKALIEQLKRHAQLNGVKAWQSYARRVLEEALHKPGR